jgi:OHCU decarboxylase
MTLAEFNAMERDQAASRLLTVCGSPVWASAMCDRRPFKDAKQMAEIAEEIWWGLKQPEWLEAFRAHPRIGEQSSSKWSEQEQAGTRNASASSVWALVEGNRTYFDKFGYIFIVCATGKSTEEMLRILESRLPNEPEREIRIAATEHAKIMQLRLQKLLS